MKDGWAYEEYIDFVKSIILQKKEYTYFTIPINQKG